MKLHIRMALFALVLSPISLMAQLQNDFSIEKTTMNMSLGNLDEGILKSQKAILKFLIQETPLRINLFYSSDRSLEQLKAELENKGFAGVLNASKGRINFIPVAENDLSWARDFSPLIINEGPLKKLVTFRYANNEKLGQTAAQAIAEIEKIKEPIHALDLFQENGNILMDDQGRLFVTEMLLLKNSNLGKQILLSQKDILYKLDKKPITPKSKAQVEKMLRTELGAKEVVWLPRIESETTGHVDMVAKIVGLDKVIVANSKKAEISEKLDEIADQFKKRGYRVFRLNLAKEGLAEFRSYTNSEIIGNMVMIPMYGSSATDKAAVDLYTELGFKVFQIPGESIVKGGSVHCLTFGY